MFLLLLVEKGLVQIHNLSLEILGTFVGLSNLEILLSSFFYAWSIIKHTVYSKTTINESSKQRDSGKIQLCSVSFDKEKIT